MARGKASWALGYFGLPRSSAGSRRGSLLGICTACDKNEAYFQLQRNLLYCLAPTLSQATDQVDRVGMVPCTLSIKSALDWVPMPGIRLASKLIILKESAWRSLQNPISYFIHARS
ncbi:MAG: hypothetical protein CL912_30330 [Deltaproteobacteria bacterium]|nr:hypothetical protein [Deltaproteobacteria bacterium]